jgi:hypothetical protein
MQFKVTCPSCGKDRIVLEDNVFVCKNQECDDFNCFFEFNTEFINRELGQNIVIVSGYTGEQTFEIESGRYHEKYKNGKLIECEQLEKYE